ncbi:hypothetical protein [Actinomadura rugatobispora]|uniref:Uncharacterized protein n=1 Tax=Actinomadura rugatobispora TaxID=1994 RepID=A0ABW1A4E1_9ACTN|nr:hypothetical protein GCM10010200_047990 [Actinomadura rugatobispora]
MGGDVHAAGTTVQAGLGIEESPERFFQPYMNLKQWMLNPGLVRASASRPGRRWNA